MLCCAVLSCLVPPSRQQTLIEEAEARARSEVEAHMTKKLQKMETTMEYFQHKVRGHRSVAVR